MIWIGVTLTLRKGVINWPLKIFLSSLSRSLGVFLFCLHWIDLPKRHTHFFIQAYFVVTQKKSWKNSIENQCFVTIRFNQSRSVSIPIAFYLTWTLESSDWVNISIFLSASFSLSINTAFEVAVYGDKKVTWFQRQFSLFSQFVCTGTPNTIHTMRIVQLWIRKNSIADTLATHLLVFCV